MFRRPQKEPPREELFDVDLEHGTVQRKGDGIRVMAVSSLGWASLEKELASTFTSGAAVILQRMGYSYGRYLGRLSKAKGQTPDQAFEVMQSFSTESGWGQMRLNGGDLNKGDARIVVKGCFFCANRAEGTEPVCNMLAGVVGGLADEILGVTHRVVELKCLAKGDSVCEITVERVG